MVQFDFSFFSERFLLNNSIIWRRTKKAMSMEMILRKFGVSFPYPYMSSSNIVKWKWIIWVILKSPKWELLEKQKYSFFSMEIINNRNQDQRNNKNKTHKPKSITSL